MVWSRPPPPPPPGIIHKCSHPEDGDYSSRVSQTAMFVSMFAYIDEIVSLVTPTRLLYMAVDGVAPRAKMNQQRARRFRSAKDMAEAVALAVRRGEDLPPGDPFDSNCITPGTPFMTAFNDHLRYYVEKKQSEDRIWRQFEVILSGHEVPGEGEHKIMEYIRHSKSQPNYPSNLRHCLYGLDADLIMLGLLSHEPHFVLLREEVDFSKFRRRGNKRVNIVDASEKKKTNWQMMHLSILREYLDHEFRPTEPWPHGYDLERVLDDFILLCFFVGNDFIPHLPGLDIGDGAIQTIFATYCRLMPTLGGYLTHEGEIDLARLQPFIFELSVLEREYFAADRKSRRGKGKRHDDADDDLMDETGWTIPGQSPFHADIPPDQPLTEAEEFYFGDDGEIQHWTDVKAKASAPPTETKSLGVSQGWRRLYYESKFGHSLDDLEFCHGVQHSYVEGLVWVLRYYYQGVCSWSWFYPFHYAPLASDLAINLADRFEGRIKLDLGQPFLPFQQLMAVLPARSSSLLPPSLRALMTDTSSPIADFYPESFALDSNGKKNEWEYICLIPFIDEARLLQSMATCELSEEESRRNIHGPPLSFRFDQSHPGTDLRPAPSKALPPLRSTHVVCSVHRLPQSDRYTPGLLPGARTGAQLDSPFPSLQRLHLRMSVTRKGAVNVFGRPSRNESIHASLASPGLGWSADNAVEAARLLGETVMVGFPYLREALVVGVSDVETVIALPSCQVLQHLPSQPTPAGLPGSLSAAVRGVSFPTWNRMNGLLCAGYKDKKSLSVTNSRVLVHAHAFAGMTKCADGSTEKTFSAQREIVQPLDLCIQADHSDPRFLPAPPQPIETRLPLGTRILHHGSPGVVVGFDPQLGRSGERRVDIKVEIDDSGLGGFAAQLATEHQVDGLHSWIAPHTLTKSLRVDGGASAMVLGKLCACAFMRLKDDELDFGLRVKFQGKELCSPGWTRRSSHGSWEYSSALRDLLKEYAEAFPEVIASLQKHPTLEVYDAHKVFNGDTRLRWEQLKLWLKKHRPEMHLEPVGSLLMSETGIDLLEQRLITMIAERGAAKTQTITSVDVSDLFAPSIQAYTPKQPLALGNRVVCVDDSCVVGFGKRGTVVGVVEKRRMVRVLMDEPFLGGLTFANTERGVLLEATSFMSVASALSVHPKKAAKAKKKVAAPVSPVPLHGLGGAKPGPAVWVKPDDPVVIDAAAPLIDVLSSMLSDVQVQPATEKKNKAEGQWWDSLPTGTKQKKQLAPQPGIWPKKQSPVKPGAAVAGKARHRVPLNPESYLPPDVDLTAPIKSAPRPEDAVKQKPKRGAVKELNWQEQFLAEGGGVASAPARGRGRGRGDGPLW